VKSTIEICPLGQRRTDLTDAELNETQSNYLTRTADPRYSAVRTLLQGWLDRVHDEDAKKSLASRLRRQDDDVFDSAFWELYLHEAYRRGGYSVTFHPPLQQSSASPDFLVERLHESFYVEATTVQQAKKQRSADRRLAVVLDAFHNHEVDLPFRVAVNHGRVGHSSPSTAKLIRRVSLMLSGGSPASWSWVGPAHRAIAGSALLPRWAVPVAMCAVRAPDRRFRTAVSRSSRHILKAMTMRLQAFGGWPGVREKLIRREDLSGDEAADAPPRRLILHA
jgi:hypothetical protein